MHRPDRRGRSVRRARPVSSWARVVVGTDHDPGQEPVGGWGVPPPGGPGTFAATPSSQHRRHKRCLRTVQESLGSGSGHPPWALRADIVTDATSRAGDIDL
ncbi:hypothetical protein Franean1_1683 [Parafrankia sp. EAN1pec]|nr:hypothetical protein Franean1_1683 [Frankia sp. EAN1pec]